MGVMFLSCDTDKPFTTMHAVFNKFVLFFCCLALASAAIAGTESPVQVDSASDWKEVYLGVGARMPFSFMYAGKDFASVCKDWHVEITKTTVDENKDKYLVTRSKDGIVVVLEVLVFKDFPAVEWTLWLENRSEKDSELFESIKSADIRFAGYESGVNLHYTRGDHQNDQAFEPLLKKMADGDTQSLEPIGGRPSDGYMPFFNFANHTDTRGIISGIGWTGQWKADFEYASNAGLRYTVGLREAKFKMKPGEKFRLPSVLLLFWQGNDFIDGQNLFRRMALKHYSPVDENGHLLEVPTSASIHAMLGFNDMTEKTVLEVFDLIAKSDCGFDTLFIDAGWEKGGFPLGQGNFQCNPERFPNGLAAVGKACDQKDMKFLLWFEPERAMRGTWIVENHPDWVLPAHKTRTSPEFQYMVRDGFYLVNLGNDQARQWLQNWIVDFMEKNGVDIYRQDFNIAPYYCWITQDEPERVSVAEIKYVMGEWKYLDHLRSHFDDLVIDNCASGGRRLDLEMMKRSYCFWRCDTCWQPRQEQCYNYGISMWQPLTGRGALSSTDSYRYRSGYGTFCSMPLAFDCQWALQNRPVRGALKPDSGFVVGWWFYRIFRRFDAGFLAVFGSLGDREPGGAWTVLGIVGGKGV